LLKSIAKNLVGEDNSKSQSTAMLNIENIRAF
jgi:hypothetical protein